MTESSTAVISACGLFRYSLIRRWGLGRLLVWLMLNPSTADASNDDPTVRRVRGFTKREGFGGFVIVNAWALIETDSKELHRRRSAFEPENMLQLDHVLPGADVIVAWGHRMVHGPGLQLVKQKLEGAGRVRCLGFTEGGEPRHPLMLRADTPLEAWPRQGDR